jgi:hypothetical protein
MLYLALMAAVAVGVAWLGARAYRDEYLVVLHWHGAGTVWFERRDGERYTPLSVAALPLAALRYAGRAASLRMAHGAAAEKQVAAPTKAALAHR